MASTLADEFLADLDEGEAEAPVSEDEEVPEGMEDEENGDQQMEDGEEEKKEKELEARLLATLKQEDITKVATLLSTTKFKELMKV